jgi:transposase
MLQFAPGVKVYLACKPVDMRRGFDGLAADVAQTLRADPYSGAAFVFRSKRGDSTAVSMREARAGARLGIWSAADDFMVSPYS